MLKSILVVNFIGTPELYDWPPGKYSLCGGGTSENDWHTTCYTRPETQAPQPWVLVYWLEASPINRPVTHLSIPADL